MLNEFFRQNCGLAFRVETRHVAAEIDGEFPARFTLSITEPPPELVLHGPQYGAGHTPPNDGRGGARRRLHCGLPPIRVIPAGVWAAEYPEALNCEDFNSGCDWGSDEPSASAWRAYTACEYAARNEAGCLFPEPWQDRIDALRCPYCGGRMRVICAIRDPNAIAEPRPQSMPTGEPTALSTASQGDAAPRPRCLSGPSAAREATVNRPGAEVRLLHHRPTEQGPSTSRQRPFYRVQTLERCAAGSPRSPVCATVCR